MDIDRINLATVALRIALSVIIGGSIGYQREYRHQNAGIKTHILICMGACMTMLTNQFIFEYISSSVDPSRMGAQVISGIGFLGVGTIIVTGKRHVKGLTTATGLWAAASIGLAIGVGFYLGAICGGVAIYAVFVLVGRYEDAIKNRRRIMLVYFELKNTSDFAAVRTRLTQLDAAITDTEATRYSADLIGFTLTLQLGKHTTHSSIIEELTQLSVITFVTRG